LFTRDEVTVKLREAGGIAEIGRHVVIARDQKSSLLMRLIVLIRGIKLVQVRHEQTKTRFRAATKTVFSRAREQTVASKCQCSSQIASCLM